MDKALQEKLNNLGFTIETDADLERAIATSRGYMDDEREDFLTRANARELVSIYESTDNHTVTGAVSDEEAYKMTAMSLYEKAVEKLGQPRVTEIVAYCEKNNVDVVGSLLAELEYHDQNPHVRRGARK